MEITEPLREIDVPVARELAETLLIQKDIQNSLSSIRLWSQKYTLSDQPDPETRTILGSLFRDGVVQFVGCFDKANRHPLSVQEIYCSVSGADVYFKWLSDLRNSYAAHRYGAGRQCVVGVIVNPKSGVILGRGPLLAVYAGPNSAGHKDLINFIQMAANYVTIKVEALWTRFDSEAQKLAVNDLINAPVAQVRGLDPTEMGKSRGALKRGQQKEDPK